MVHRHVINSVVMWLHILVGLCEQKNFDKIMMHSTNVKIMEAECSALMSVTMNITTQLYILDQTTTTQFIITTAQFVGARGGVVVKALRYKPACRGFDSRWCQDFSP